MTRTVYEVWRVKHPRNAKYGDKEFERRTTEDNIEVAIGYARDRLNTQYSRYERRADEDQTTEQADQRFDDPQPTDDVELPVGSDDSIRYKGVIKHVSEGDSVTVTKPRISLYIVEHEVPE